MAQGNVSVRVRAEVQSVTGVSEVLPEIIQRFAAGAGTNGIIQYVTLGTSAFTAFSPPSGAKYLIATISAGAKSLFLKNVTGDATGIALIGSAASGQPFVVAMPVSSPGIGILNNDSGVAATVELRWY